MHFTELFDLTFDVELFLGCRPNLPYRVFNTWMGDPGKLLLLQEVLKVVRRDELLSVVRAAGDVLYKGLRSLEKEFPNLLSATRGRGTFLAVDAPSGKVRDDLIARLRAKGECSVAWRSLFFPTLSFVLL